MFEFITVRELYELYINDRNQLDGIEYVATEKNQKFYLGTLNMLNYKDGSVQIEIVGKSDF